MSGRLTIKGTIISAAVGAVVGLLLADRMNAKRRLSVEEAIEFYHREYDRPVIGYWIDGEDIILNVVPRIPEEPAQWVVEPSGLVYNTNPLRNKVIALKPMKKIPTA